MFLPQQNIRKSASIMYMTLQIKPALIGKFTFILTYRKILTIIYLGKQVSLTNLEATYNELRRRLQSLFVTKNPLSCRGNYITITLTKKTNTTQILCYQNVQKKFRKISYCFCFNQKPTLTYTHKHPVCTKLKWSKSATERSHHTVVFIVVLLCMFQLMLLIIFSNLGRFTCLYLYHYHLQV